MMYGLKTIASMASPLAALALASCHAAGGGSEPPPVRIDVVRATATECADTCASIDLSITVSNDSDYATCLSIRNFTPAISRSIYLTSLDGKTNYDEFRTAFDAEDQHPDVPGMEAKHVEMLRKEPNIYVPPKSTISYEASTAAVYKLPKIPANINLSAYIYACDAEQFSRHGYVRRVATSRLTYD
jgi:hypothetical protein